MRKLIPIFTSFFLLLALLVLLTGPTSAQGPEPPPKGSESTPVPPPVETPPGTLDRTLLPKIEPQLLKKLLQNRAQPAPFIAYLKTQTDLAAVSGGVAAQAEVDPLARRTAVVEALQQTARSTQAGLLQSLQGGPGLAAAQRATDINPLWIVNAVAASGSLELVLAVAARADVAVVRLDKSVQLDTPREPVGLPFSTPLLLPALQSPTWGITKIRADLVHNALNLDGSGIVVASIDSGVDWQHPVLQTRYRGYTGPGKLPQHAGNWYDATGDGATYPVDGQGHGTHTMGTMVGGNGVGVAPGARWITVRAFDSSGTALNSWLHEAFQWVLAPDGKSALAPVIVNNSWGNDFGSSTEFEADVQALLDAGIYPVFSAGNNGPGAGTVGSPGSLDIAFAVGATTSDDEVALFSSRGPSPWGTVKPDVSAPGKAVLSTLPGGAYGELNGTSMAAPHVSGLAALLLQASPGLAGNLSDISNVILSTAVPLGSPIPNNDYGWGRIDAYQAVMSVGNIGTLAGSVTRTGGASLKEALVSITPHGGGPTINTTTDATGAYVQGLAPGTYDATASAFGYQPASAFNLVINSGAATTQNFSLTPQPTGTLQGTIRESGSLAPLVATIRIEDTPASTVSNADGSYSLVLPVGTYTATVIAARHRISQAVNITINDGAMVTQNFWLDPAPAILLVDSGRWYQESQIDFYHQTLTDLHYPYDTWQITKPFDDPNDIPSETTLAGYDIVIWSSPLDSPGYIGAEGVLESYLDGGGKLLLSGQDVAFFDGGGSLFGTVPYFKNYLKARYIQDDSGLYTVTGPAGEPFAGLSVTITGGDGADNQFTPDVVANAEADFAGPLLAYAEDSLAGLHIGLCVPYRALFLSFGFEGISTRADRQTVMEQALTWLMAEPATAGVELTPGSQTLIGSFGSVVSHTVRARNTGTSDNSYSLSYSSNWPVYPPPPTSLSLTTCQTQVITLPVTVDTTAWHTADLLSLTIQSTGGPLVTDTVTRTTKSPAPVLLVDDDRWYSFAAEYQEALESNNIPYDYWLVPKSWSGSVPPSPPLATLQMYPMTVWYTAYDWFQPLTPEEQDRLAAYLEGGGRLFFSSQDYIYNLPDGQPDQFTQDYLGVLTHTEDFSSTVVTGQPGNPVGDHLGPYALTFPPGYKNWTDALTPTATAQVATRGQAGQPNAVTLVGPAAGNRYWHTNFLAYGPELLAPADRARLMQRAVGWLSWLGRSTVQPSVTAALEGAPVIYTATVINDGWDHLPTAYFTATRPAAVTWGSDRSPALSLAGDSLVWSGSLARNESQVLTYTGTIAGSLPLGTEINQTSWLAYPDHAIVFDRIATVRVNFPDLSQSRRDVWPTQADGAGDTLTYTLVLKNDGLVDDPLVTTTNTLPHMLELVSVDSPSQGNAVSSGKTVTWTTSLAKNEVATLTYRAVISYKSSQAIENVAYVNDGLNETLVLKARTTFKSGPIYLPVVFK